ncbi:hypothetical protein [Parabacteroides distasonis]|uniref:hypothetical protein n=1 Tax=Parabacteroides distasonis TaxID=823 RepID=UPI00189C3CAD|nr:hypothetical protein [Parabacteroides distasonis]MDB9190820.1 hypothetical protein [Parabacteroides distasonis]MDB9199682.1 hypothetical protein [Parabacteroides distasonis]
MGTITIHPAEAYLRNEQNPTSLYVRIGGQRRRLFINRDENVIGIVAPRKRRSGYIFTDWASIEKIYYPSLEQDTNTDRKLVLKYQKLARLATHTNDWLRTIADADLDKSLYENHITTGTRIDGKCIGLATIEKYCGTAEMYLFRQAMKNKKSFSTCRFDFCGYDGTLWCEPRDNGDMAAGFSKEYRNCGNGYYYLLINDEYMIGYDID